MSVFIYMYSGLKVTNQIAVNVVNEVLSVKQLIHGQFQS